MLQHTLISHFYQQHALKRLLLNLLTAGIALIASAQVAPRIPGSLAGRNIALWASHGRYFDLSDDRWKWQRCRLFGTVEDLLTRAYVVPLLTPMLENAGASVMMPRERDASAAEYIVAEPHLHNGKRKWKRLKAGFALPDSAITQGVNPFALGSSHYAETVNEPKQRESAATWSCPIAHDGEYALYVSWQPSPNPAPDAHYIVHTATGDVDIYVDQTRGAATWTYLGTFPFAFSKDDLPRLTLTNRTAQPESTVSADAMRIGGGMGSISRAGQVSGIPRWAEAARYWLQYAGMPDSVYSSQKGLDDYRDDIYARPLWVNHLKDQLNVPIDLALALHSDAGLLPGDSIVGTLGIISTDDNHGKFSDGRSRELSRLLANHVLGSVYADISRLYEPNWTIRPTRDKRYIEARLSDVPTLLLEMFAHQNPADMRYALDPQFQHDMARAIYKGVLRFLNPNGVVTPLPPRAFAVNATPHPGRYILTWEAQPDSLEPSATPTHYFVEQRGEDGFWRKVAQTDSTRFAVEIPRRQLHSWRVRAANDGGQSFPSEVLAAGWTEPYQQPVTIVNGFTRLSAPDFYATENRAGFGTDDPGVPFAGDLTFTGRQYNFDRLSSWEHDDQPGFGASYANAELTPRGGNDFDMPARHGQALLKAGIGFVSSSLDAFTADTISYPHMVDLILGAQRSTSIGRGVHAPRHAAFSPQLQRRLTQLHLGNVPMIVSGAYIGSDMLATDAQRQWLRQTLGVKFHSDHASASGTILQPRNHPLQLNMHSPYALGSLDALAPAASDARPLLRYADTMTPAAIATPRTITLGFPLEAAPALLPSLVHRLQSTN